MRVVLTFFAAFFFSLSVTTCWWMPLKSHLSSFCICCRSALLIALRQSLKKFWLKVGLPMNSLSSSMAAYMVATSSASSLSVSSSPAYSSGTR